MKTVTVGQLRQNPTDVLADVEAGTTYAITRHSHVIGHIIPPNKTLDIAPPKKSGAAHTQSLERVELTSAASIDDLIDDARGDW
ncbi:hypothetical protein A5740_14045 [Mycobacterium sp. GA-1841]|uniref:type II toxin-antitoxin system Phd/YefM family antitoxin n=1 Tax=Mycobacterium sp. GA-1841 TaxID=1834154 RepID=UPI00096CE8CD|nr:hypothetical protein [Mycobacterium sp. GA-1841]OMC31806.1 hypothetical protein A5740_14045 [Mycobacterium sp. GA-1841]